MRVATTDSGSPPTSASAAGAIPKAISACRPASPTACTAPSTVEVQPAVTANGPTLTTREQPYRSSYGPPDPRRSPTAISAGRYDTAATAASAFGRVNAPAYNAFPTI